jgi:hypothetical protein
MNSACPSHYVSLDYPNNIKEYRVRKYSIFSGRLSPSATRVQIFTLAVWYKIASSYLLYVTSRTKFYTHTKHVKSYVSRAVFIIFCSFSF